MDTVKRKRALTLAELLIAMTLSVILILAISYQFVAMVRFSNALKNKAEPSREAYVVMAHMTNVLHFAIPLTATNPNPPLFDPATNTLKVQIEGGHNVSGITTAIGYEYRRSTGVNDNNCFYFSNQENSQWVKLSEYCTGFNASWDEANNLLTIQLTFAIKNGPSITDQTTIKALGE